MAARLAGKSKTLAVDAGCGPGKWLKDLASRFSHVIGVDQSPKLLNKARKDNRGLLKSNRNIKLRSAADLARPCQHKKGPDGKEFCSPSVTGTREAADLVISFNVLLSPDKKHRANILRREAEMLRPSPKSTLLLLVPSAESYLGVRELYREKGGAESGLGSYDDYLVHNPQDEAKHVFLTYARTQYYTKEEACHAVEAAGLKCEKVLTVPYDWKFVFPETSEYARRQVLEDAKISPHEWLVVAHPQPSELVQSKADFL